MSRRLLLADRSGSSAVEMALLLPVLMILLYGGFELGHFVWTKHKLVEAVRDGARFAAHYEAADICQGGVAVMSDDLKDQVRLITRTGQLVTAEAQGRIPGWTDAQTAVDVSCTFTDTGIYRDFGENGPIVTVTAVNVPYPSLFGQLSGVDPQLEMSARSSAVVIGVAGVEP